MPVDVTIKLRGLAVCFKKRPPNYPEEVWNVAFLCDKYHPLDLKIHGVDQQRWRPKQDIFLLVEHDNIEPACTETNFEELLNISSTYGHGPRPPQPGKPLLSNLEIIERGTKPKTTDLIWMEVPRSALSVDMRDREHTKIMKTHPVFGVPTRVADRGKEVWLTFQVNGRIHLAILEYESPYPVIRRIPIDPVANAINIEFMNRCDERIHGDKCNRNDFVDIYEFACHMDGINEVRYVSWAEDAETRRIAFSKDPRKAKKQKDDLDKLLKDKDDPWFVTDQYEDGSLEIQKKRYKDLIDRRRANPYGNCDPVGSEPPPGP